MCRLLFIVYCLFGSPLATALAAATLPGVRTIINTYNTLHNNILLECKKEKELLRQQPQ